jgi:hypothetical protein
MSQPVASTWLDQNVLPSATLAADEPSRSEYMYHLLWGADRGPGC